MTTLTSTPRTPSTSQTRSQFSFKAKLLNLTFSTLFTDNMRGARFIRGLKNLVPRSMKNLSYHREQESTRSLSFDFDRDWNRDDWSIETSDTSFQVGPYRACERLGSGSFGSVYICKHMETGKKYAGKLFEKVFARDNMPMVLSEVAMLKELSHENTISFVDLVYSRHGVLLVMELVDGSDLHAFMLTDGGIMESFARVVFEQLLKAVQHLHNQGIVHRDIKIENVMVDKRGTVKLVDYGLAEKAVKHRGRLMVKGYCGTRVYFSPELAQCELDGGDDNNIFAGDKIDIWAAGIFLYFIVCGHDPFIDVTKDYLLYDIADGNLRWDVDVSLELKDLLKKIMRTDPDERLSIEDILEHPWMKGEKLPPNTKQTFKSDSGRVHVEFDETFPEKAVSLPIRFPVCRDESQRGKRTESMNNLVDWRLHVTGDSATLPVETSEFGDSFGEEPSFKFHYADSSSEASTRKATKSPFEADILPRVSGLKKLVELMSSLFRRNRRGRELTDADIAQVW